MILGDIESRFFGKISAEEYFGYCYTLDEKNNKKQNGDDVE